MSDDSAKVLVHVMQRNHVAMIVDFLAESIGQASKAAHLHPHGEVLTLHV